MRKIIIGTVTLGAAVGAASLGVVATGQSAHGASLCVRHNGVTYAQFGTAFCVGSGTSVAVGTNPVANTTRGGIATAAGVSSNATTINGISTQAGTTFHTSTAGTGASATGANCDIGAPPGSNGACPPPVLVP